MSRIVFYATILSASLVAAAVPAQARQISVWGNSFTTDDGPSLTGPASAGQFHAMVEHPERYRTGPHHRAGVMR